MSVSRDLFYRILDMFRDGKTIQEISKETNIEPSKIDKLYQHGSSIPPRPSIKAMLIEEQRQARSVALNMIKKKHSISDKELDGDETQGLDLSTDESDESMSLAKEVIEMNEGSPENHTNAINSAATTMVEGVEDRLGSVKYVRALKALLSRQAPTVKKAMSTIEQAIDDIAFELPKMSAAQKLNVVSKLSGYIETWQGSVEAAIRLERLLLGEPDSHVAVTEMSQEDALKRLDRLRTLAAQANSRIVEAEERRTS